MKKILLLPVILSICACDSGELAEIKKELKGSDCKVNIPATCAEFITQSEQEKLQRQNLIKEISDEWSDTKTYIVKLKKQHGDKLCESQDYANIINQYEKLINGFNQHTTFGVPLKDRNYDCVSPLSKAAKLCNYDISFGDWESLVLAFKNVYATYLELCDKYDVYKSKKDVLVKDLNEEKHTKCNKISFCHDEIRKGCITTLPMDRSCLTTGVVVFVDDSQGGVFVQPRQDSVSTMFANGFINAFGLGENVACRDVYFIKTNKQFFSEDRVSLSGYWRYIGPYKYLESNAERTTKAFERVHISDELNALCGGKKQTSSNNEFESLMHILGQ